MSRFQASICLVDNEIQLRDLESKFGTLVLVKDEIDLFINNKLNFQVGRTFFTLNVVNSDKSLEMEKK